MAGMTPAGFELKRLPEIISESKQRAVPIFQDLLTNPNDVVDTSDSSTIGRLVNLQAPSIVDLWEALQGVYSAFDLNSAEGIALDNLAELVGDKRQSATASSVPLVLTLDVPCTIPAGSLTTASDTGTEWRITNTLSTNIANPATSISVTCAAPTGPQDYTITYTVGTSTSVITYSATGTETPREVAEGLKFVIDSVHNLSLKTSLVGSVLSVERIQPLNTAKFSISNNISLTQMKLVNTAVCSEVGATRQETGTITNIATPVFNWSAVYNPVPATVGSERETDERFRDRLLTSRSQRASNTWDALYSDLTGLEGVFSVNIEENDTELEVNGVSPYSFVAVVLGGADTDIGQAIWRNKPLGIPSEGNTSVLVKDVQGTNRNVYFSRPSQVPIYIEMTIVLDSSVFPGDGVDRIKQSIIDFTTGSYQIGDDVIYSRLFSPINQIQGHYVNSLFIGTAPSPTGTANIPIAFNEIASFSSANIVINTM